MSVYVDGMKNSGMLGAFDGVGTTAYYPAGNDTWREDVMMQNYSGYIKWVSYERHTD
ncbi:MAG: hypothetical protein LUD79_07080 [Oscillospiraceae bacterium]|nr:hypothetical protein [Oscillospiraceae bacterium]